MTRRRHFTARPVLALLALIGFGHGVASAAEAPRPFEFLFLDDRVVSLRFPGVELPIRTPFDLASVGRALPGYAVEASGAEDGETILVDIADVSPSLLYIGDGPQGQPIQGIRSRHAIDRDGAAPGLAVTRVYRGGKGRCGDAFGYGDNADATFWCAAPSSPHIHYAIDVEACPKAVDLGNYRRPPAGTDPRRALVYRPMTLHDCMKITDLVLVADRHWAEPKKKPGDAR